MLKNVKAMILEKQEYLEAAQILFEDATQSNIDDLIVLGESKEDDILDDDEKDDDDLPGGSDDDQEDDEEDEEDDDQGDDMDLGNMPLDDSEPKDDDKQEPAGSEEDDILKTSIEDEMSGTLSATDDLPSLVGKQTGEPINDNIDDFLNVTIDLRSNTLTDILPIPPNNADEAIADDILSTRVDSGFGEDSNAAAELPMGESEEDDLLNESLSITRGEFHGNGSVENISEFNFLEAISLGGDDKPAEGAGDPGDPPDEGAGEVPTEGGADSAVTAAVKDKLAEADAPIDAAGTDEGGKEKLLKKLGSITKSLEDAKQAVMNTIQ